MIQSCELGETSLSKKLLTLWYQFTHPRNFYPDPDHAGLLEHF